MSGQGRCWDEKVSGVGKSFNKSIEVETPEHPVLGEHNHPISDKTVSNKRLQAQLTLTEPSCLTKSG